MAGLLSGDTQILSTGFGEALGLANQGQVRILAVTSDERLSQAPDVPTVKEAGIDVTFASIKLYGDPPWRIRQGKPMLAADPIIRNGLDPIANELRPKSKSRTAIKDDPIVEADPERELRPYSVREFYETGDRISHPKFGEGVVQKPLGPNKVDVRFGDESRVLVQGRG